MALGEHLRADKYVGIASLGQRERRVYRTLLLGTVAVDARNSILGKSPPQGFFQPFGAGAERSRGSAATGAAVVEFAACATVMTAQPDVFCMYRHPRITAAALGDMSTASADQGWCKAATIQEHQDLTIAAEMSGDGLREWFAQSVGYR